MGRFSRSTEITLISLPFPCPRIRQITAAFIGNALPPITMLVWGLSMLLALATRNIRDHLPFKPSRPSKRATAALAAMERRSVNPPRVIKILSVFTTTQERVHSVFTYLFL